MCEFCTQHGEGKKWYLAMENYSRDLLDQDSRREYVAHFLNHFVEANGPGVRQLEAVMKTPFYPAVRAVLQRNARRNHFGQVVTVEEVAQILEMVGEVVRLPCVCRRLTTGNLNARYCYGLIVDQRLNDGLDDSFSLEILQADQALASIRALDREGLMHSVWTFKTPYIGGLCNCDQDCMAYRANHSHGYFKNMFRGEAIAVVDQEACNGCKACIRQCQFGAMRYSAANKKVMIDPRLCYGCGVCRAACHHEAITMRPRSESPVASRIW
ncbi:MAG: 4Fe-4S binding protein [Anaerolineales bacterium]|nr:4Fe-4S binding protein [Anaerolineales bacterium]